MLLARQGNVSLGNWRDLCVLALTVELVYLGSEGSELVGTFGVNAFCLCVCETYSSCECDEENNRNCLPYPP
jgi:hypothetical protein